MTNILHKLALLLCLLAITASAFAGPEAEYKKLSKASKAMPPTSKAH